MERYKIIGADQNEYGPADAGQLRHWIAEGRANAATLARVETAEIQQNWKPLRDFPEFAEALAAQTAPAPARAVRDAPDPDPLAREILARDYQIDIGDCFSRGWQLVKQDFWLLVGATALIAIIQIGLESVPFIGSVAGTVLFGPFIGGLCWLFLKRLRGQPADLGDAFAGFGPAFVPLLLAGILWIIGSAIGLLLCIVPGVYLLVAWSFALLLVIDKQLDFWPALELSRKVVQKHWWQIFFLTLLGTLVALVGIVAFVVGVFVTFSIATGAGTYAYEQIFGSRPDPAAAPALAVSDASAAIPPAL